MVSAYQIGPFVLSAPRFFAALGLVVLVVAAEVIAWRRRREGSTPTASAAWAWNAALAVVLGARVGFVMENFEAFLARPLAILQFWQGGFSPWWGVAVGVLVATTSVLRGSAKAASVAVPAVLGIAVWLAVPALVTPTELEARQLPPLTLERLEGGQLDLASLRGGPVVINLWATWCPPCRRELPMLAEAARSYPGVHFVLADQAEGRHTVQQYLDGRKDLFIEGVVLDADTSLASEFSTRGLPTTLFFDREGNHVFTHAGELSAVMLANYLADLLTAN